MNEPKFFRGRPIIQIGETYEVDGTPHTVVTATSHIIGATEDGIELTEPLYWLDNLSTNERVYMGKEELESKFKDINN
jgi:hypothetical protein